jgi:hypothetical protein
MPRIVIIILIYHRHKPIDIINLWGSYRRRNVFSVRYGQTYSYYLSQCCSYKSVMNQYITWKHRRLGAATLESGPIEIVINPGGGWACQVSAAA